MALGVEVQVKRPGKGKPLRPLDSADVASVLEVVLAGVLDNFSRQTDAAGESFGVVSPDYAEDVGRVNATLIRTGAFVSSGQIKIKGRSKGAVVFSTPYAGLIQYGTRFMQARPVVGYTLSTVNAVTRRVGVVLRRRLQRRKSTDIGALGASDLALGAEEDVLALDGATESGVFSQGGPGLAL